ncbi:hypothetical protein [Mangrovibacterium marinum]|uniref:Uncharacterized protein n=1 Tax=Mangrovibacterium marinum TaxID=1639118 RepID=A0A2T5C627_9BACT|nr:hypothetical protein [Mangrovibacterium marinum]PTN10403.1 hypothetical protein C8N47_10151 [Mangrovibacterium marinum]
MKKIFAKGLILAMFAGLTACNDDDPTPYGVGEAYVISKLEAPATEGEDATVVYALHLEAVGQYEVPTSVTVSGPGGATYTLSSESGYFSNNEVYTTSLPAEGSYTFNYTFASGLSTTSVDALSDEVLDPAIITSVVVSDDEVELSWEEVEDADAIVVSLRNPEGEIIFSSTTNAGYLVGNKTDYTISTQQGSWAEAPAEGTTYTLEITGLLSGSASYYQAISIAEDHIVWGQTTPAE